MRAAILEGGTLRVGELPDPSPEKHQALVRTERCALCASDAHFLTSCSTIVERSKKIGGPYGGIDLSKPEGLEVLYAIARTSDVFLTNKQPRVLDKLKIGVDDLQIVKDGARVGKGRIGSSEGKLNLGTWQGVWLCEHRNRAGSRKVLVTVNGSLKDSDSQRTPVSPSSPIASTSS